MANLTKENFLYGYCYDLYQGQVENCPTVNGAMIREKVLKFRQLVPIYRQDYDRFAQLEAKHRDIIAPGTHWPRLSGNTVLAYAPFTIKGKKNDHHKHSLIRVPETLENTKSQAHSKIVHNTWDFFYSSF